MFKLRIGGRPLAYSSELRARYVFTILTVLSTVALLAWGAFVTSINAGLAVPDWPTSFRSYDPFNPWPDWWKITPVLAEHGHRLLGMVVGLLTIVLALWTWRADPRRWMRSLGFIALFLVIAQGVLGGLRVVLVSLDLAMVHAAVAQIFFSLMFAMTLFTSRPWVEARDILPESDDTRKLRTLSGIAVLAVFGQIILGVFLRHPGTGIDPWLAGAHIGGAVAVGALILILYTRVQQSFAEYDLVRKAANAAGGLLLLQVALGFTAYFVILDEQGILQPSNVQVLVNSLHLVVGGLLLASVVLMTLIVGRRPTLQEATAPVQQRLETA